MKRLVAGALVLLGALGGTSVALAGANAGGTIILHDADVIYTSDDYDYCGQGTAPATCQTADTRVEGADRSHPKVFKAYAAFPGGSSPRLKGMCFGVHYTAPDVTVVGYGHCIGDLNNGAGEISQFDWPAPDTGTSIVFEQTQTSHLVEFYWFAGYSYYQPRPAIFELRDHPDPGLGGVFGDDSVPSNLDSIAGYGSLGFDTDGAVDCPEGGPVPVQDSSWGRIKRQYQ